MQAPLSQGQFNPNDDNGMFASDTASLACAFDGDLVVLLREDTHHEAADAQRRGGGSRAKRYATFVVYYAARRWT